MKMKVENEKWKVEENMDNQTTNGEKFTIDITQLKIKK